MESVALFEGMITYNSVFSVFFDNVYGVADMTSKDRKGLACWARFRFSIIGGLLAHPPEQGELKRQLEKLASQP